MAISESDYKEMINDLIIEIEDALEELDNGIDYESSDGILTIFMVNKSQIIINRQTAALQLWLAAKSGGFHFDYTDNGWQDDRTGESLLSILNRCLSEQANENIELELS